MEKEAVRVVQVIAKNKKTKENLLLGVFNNAKEAQWEIENNLEYDEDDIIEDWEIVIEDIK